MLALGILDQKTTLRALHEDDESNERCRQCGDQQG